MARKGQTKISKDVLDKFWTDEELEKLELGGVRGFSGDPDDWTSQQYETLVREYLRRNPDAVEPEAPGYKQVYDPFTMGLEEGMNQRLDALHMDTRGLEKFRGEALRTGPSAWSNLMRRAQDQEALAARDQGFRQARGANAAARTELAMRGGMTSGARERAARQGQRDFLDMSQNIARQKSQNNLQIGINDEQNRIQQLGMLPGMEAQAMQPELQKAQLWGQSRQFDVGNRINEGNRQNDWAMNMWKTNMEKWAANRQADATESSGK